MTQADVKTLKTERLVLRPLATTDAPEIARLIGDWEVMRWLTSPPWPYAQADAEWFLGDTSSDGCWAITIGGQFCGIIGCADELGYWLGQPYWRQGLIGEAARAVVGDYIASSAADLQSGYMLGNAVSCKVLSRLGFRPDRVQTTYSKPLGVDVQVQKMTLSKANWLARNG